MKKNYRLIHIILCVSILIIMTTCLLVGSALSRSLIIDTRGYASGQLSRIVRENTQGNVFNSTRAGEMLLGYGSASFISFGSLPQNLVTNPFLFCFDKADFYEVLEELIGHNVVIEYKTPRSNSLLSCSALNELVDIYLVDNNAALEQTHLIGDIWAFGPEVSYGVEYGRITNVIKNKNAPRSYFMSMQIGDSGDKFRHFVIDDHDLYEYSIEILRTAAMVKVHYSERLANKNIYGHRTRLFVSEIEVVARRVN